MLSQKLKWPRETSCIPNSTLQPISDKRTRSALDNQVANLFLILNTQFLCNNRDTILYTEYILSYSLLGIQNNLLSIQAFYSYSTIQPLTLYVASFLYTINLLIPESREIAERHVTPIAEVTV